MKGKVTVISKGPVTVHSYQAPADGLEVTTQLIETPKRIIAIDGQYKLEYADEVVAYAKGLGKPIDRLIISHAHPDHFLGAARFGAPIFALRETRAAIAAMADLKDPSGREVRIDDVLPTETVILGTDLVDGIPLSFEHLHGGEIADSLIIALPEHRILIAQVVSNRVHLWVADRDFAGWKANIERLVNRRYETILPGHGEPTDRTVWRELYDYLDVAGDFAGYDGATYKAKMIERFPGWTGVEIIDIANALHPAP
ncbi:glyoxylase-like metal-dependent hydrolase (beta-lactamase superfamily II) [Actinocorallia herbida]|uniref:Glyoxylase-like metal-dependent hydrolase (Beta-lactamase superfamily II) n=1 Tax=Actinocorallia herbida TaxID=58109 RepID=A0A3N1D807_9ACTN|nr:MBL fold metallo-hydrolase [Actinocorallia herbida]ROO89599.1 glyoxylase-like metal-dependent hydrolase (beta-lactamase superfamily II) [Actinocorallia herbida]